MDFGNSDNVNVVFVILHFNLIEITEQCVESIVNKVAIKKYRILIVDNASNNGSGYTLQHKYADNSNVEVIICEKNLGFSAGNNIGYAKAKEYGADFIVIMNNDTEMIQNDFVEIMISKYLKEKCFVIGPDIITPEGKHQSPESTSFMLGSRLWKWYFKRKVLLCALSFSYLIFGEKNTKLVELYSNHNEKRIAKIKYDEERINCQIQGACIIFCPPYIEKRVVAFEEISFMYGEEAMLGLLCSQNGWKVLYTPELKILHKDKTTSKKVYKGIVLHELEYTRMLTNALLEVRRRERNNDRIK